MASLVFLCSNRIARQFAFGGLIYCHGILATDLFSTPYDKLRHLQTHDTNNLGLSAGGNVVTGLV